MKRTAASKFAFVIAVVVFMAAAIVLFMLIRQPNKASSNTSTVITSSIGSQDNSNSSNRASIQVPVITSHFVSSNPAHSASLADPPATVGVMFSRAIGPSSGLTVADADGSAVGLGGVSFNPDRTVMTIGVARSARGTLTVRYTECSLDNVSCEGGSFSFYVGSP